MLSRKFRRLLTLCSLVFIAFSCSTLQQLHSLSKCQFKLDTIENLSLAGVNIQNIKKPSDVNLFQAGKLALAFTQGRMPLSFRLNLDVKNPNTTKAALNQLDWILMIDNKEVLDGVVNERIEVAPNGGVSKLPLTINFDLKKALSGKSKDGLLETAFGLVGQNNKAGSKISLKARPYIKIGESNIPYPGYINIGKNFTAGL